MGIALENVAFSINLLLDMIGAVLFFALLYVIVKYKKLHKNNCLKLIGLYFLCCFGSKLIIILPYFIKVIPLLDVPLFLCVAVQFVPMSLTNSLPPFTIIIAFDRLLSVFCPIWYKQKSIPFYLPLLCILAALYPGYLAFFMVQNVLEHPTIKTTCTTGKLYGRNLNNDWNWCFNLITIICYALIFIKLLWNRQERRAYLIRQPIFKSLSLIICIQIGGWLFTTISYRYIIPLFSNLPQDQIPLLYYVVNYFSSIATTAEVPAICFTSKEHRRALANEFGWIFSRIFCWKTSPTNSVANSQNNLNGRRNGIVVICHHQS